MIKGRYLTVFAFVLMAAAMPAAAQRTRRPTARPTPTPTPLKQTASPVVLAAKQQVANQLYNVRIFVDKMGPIAVTIEDLDKQASARRLKPADAQANETNKQKLIAAIRGLRDGLVALETDFRTRPQLAQYLPRIQGISTLCGQAEDQAIAGRFVASKEPLRQVAIKLNETMAVLPGSAYSGPPVSSNASQPITVPSQSRPPVSQNVSNNNRGGGVTVGMTPSEVLASSWGSPSDKRTSRTANGTTEVWTYSGNRMVYFFNGKVSRVVQ